MNNFIVLLLCASLTGCSTYGSSFDCPMPVNAISCKSVSEVAKEIPKINQERPVIYLGGM